MTSLRAVAIGSVMAMVVIGAWARWPESALPEGSQANVVIVRKAARRLELYRDSELLEAYPISLGRHPTGAKESQGDGRTPEGVYRLDYRNPHSAFHKALHISYPTASEVTSARAQGVDPGGLVMIHGMKNGLGWLGRLHRLIDWTDGCIAMTDREMDESDRRLPRLRGK
jgi:murein L,D-transpeptidase YafK